MSKQETKQRLIDLVMFIQKKRLSENWDDSLDEKFASLSMSNDAAEKRFEMNSSRFNDQERSARSNRIFIAGHERLVQSTSDYRLKEGSIFNNNFQNFTTINRPVFDQNSQSSTKKGLELNESNFIESTVTSGSSSLLPFKRMDSSNFFHHGATSMTRSSLNSTEPLDTAIEATLQKTMEKYQSMIDEKRAELVRIFPHLANTRRSAVADRKLPTEVITERRVEPDGTVMEVHTLRARRYMRVKESISIIDGEVKNTKTRAVLEYEGPKGGYRLKLEEDCGGDCIRDVESENEDDEHDRISMVPSEISEGESTIAFLPKRSLNGIPRGNSIPKIQQKPKGKTDKAWCAAQELVDSERRYVEKLRLLDQVFRKRITADPELTKSIGEEKLAKLFSNIGALYSFHNEHLLPQLENRLQEWHQHEKLCDVVRRQAPFLKMYGEYSGNYKNAIKTYQSLIKANKRFAGVVSEIETLPECDQLPLCSHLICPVQRVTRYHLLMNEYLKHLRDGHPDKEDTACALELVKEAASHANHIMRQLDKYKNVIEVQELLGSQVPDLLTPSRELVKKSPLMKISARNGEHQARFAFLFNDMLLICSEHKNIITALSGKYKLRAIFEVDGMHVLEGDNLEVENTFYVQSGNKIIELYVNGGKEKKEWMQSLWLTIQDHNTRMQSFRKPDEKKQVIPDFDTKDNAAPVPTSTEACSNCNAVFNAFKKSYICKSCGATLCNKCCPKKMKLHSKKKKERICFNCHEELRRSNETSKDTGERKSSSVSQKISRRSILEVKPTDLAIWNGYLDMKAGNRKSWERRYFSLQEDLVLYAFKSEKDSCAKTSMPISGCRISWIDPRQNAHSAGKDANAFKLEHARRVYYLKADTPEDMAKCVAAMELASQAQVPAIGA